MIDKLLAKPIMLACAGIALLLLVWALWWVIIIRPADNARKAAEARVDASFAEARTDSAVEAGKLSTDAAKAANADDEQSRKNRDEILSQPGAAVVVDPGVSAAGRRAICLRESARNRPECQRMLAARPR